MTWPDTRTARGDLWRRARTLDGIPEQARSPRAQMLARRMRPAAEPIDWRAVVDTPAWTGWSHEERKRLAVVAGAILMAGRLSATIDGQVLAAVGRAMGEAALDRVLALPAAEHPAPPPVFSLEPDVLEDLGAAALLAGLKQITAERLARHGAAPLLRLDARQASIARDQAVRITEATACPIF